MSFTKYARPAALLITAGMLAGCQPEEETLLSTEPETAVTNAPAPAEPAAPKEPAVKEMALNELIQASLDGQLETVKKGIASGTDVNRTDPGGRTPLMYAAFQGHTEIVQHLLDAGAKIDAQDQGGSTALMFAASGPVSSTVQLLLDRGAAVNTKDSNEHFTALMWAAAEGQTENVKLLLKHGADISLKDKDGDTAESFAAQKGHNAIVELLNATAEK